MTVASGYRMLSTAVIQVVMGVIPITLSYLEDDHEKEVKESEREAMRVKWQESAIQPMKVFIPNLKKWVDSEHRQLD